MPQRREVLAAVGAGTLLATGVGAAQQGENGENGDAMDGDEDGDATDGEGEDAEAPTGQWIALLTGEQEVPPVESDATGTASIALDRHGNFHYALVVNDIENAIMTHVHRGPPGENGPVVQWLHPGAEPTQEPQLLAGRFSGVLHHGSFSANDFVGPLEGATVEEFLQVVNDGEAYVNVHTEQNPAGEIRGQLHPFAGVAEAVAAVDAETPTETPTQTPAETETPAETATAGNETDTETEAPAEESTPTETGSPGY